jgi:putative ABC transport system permease protein
MKARNRLAPARLSAADVARVATVGIRTRRLRASLSALGIAVGVAAMVAVLGLSASSQAGLLAEIDAIGTNLLTVTTGHDIFGSATELPPTAASMIHRIPSVYAVGATGATGASVFRSPLIPSRETGGMSVLAAGLELPQAVGASVAQGSYLNAATQTEPVVVLGSAAAAQLGIDEVVPGERVWLGGQWFYVIGILTSAPLAPDIDRAVLVGFPAAMKYLGFDGHPTAIYVRSATDQVSDVQAVLARMAYPEHADEVNVSRPSDALVARAEAQGAFNALFLGLAAVALLVGGVGVANIMVISVLERRGEIGLRRALGATRGQIRLQFLAEAILLGLAGGIVGEIAGAAITLLYAAGRSWPAVVPAVALEGGLGAAILIGAAAGLLPALRAARLSPTEALRGGGA